MDQDQQNSTGSTRFSTTPSPITPPTKPLTNTQPISTPSMNYASPTTPKKVGPIIATLVIILILVIAGLYLFASSINKQTVPVESNQTAVNEPIVTDTAAVPVVTNTTDNPADLQADLNTSTNGLDANNF